MPHDESMKFILLNKTKEILTKAPFAGLPKGSLVRLNPLPQDNTPPASGMLTAVGRNHIMHKLVNSLLYYDD